MRSAVILVMCCILAIALGPSVSAQSPNRQKPTAQVGKGVKKTKGSFSAGPPNPAHVRSPSKAKSTRDEDTQDVGVLIERLLDKNRAYDRRSNAAYKLGELKAAKAVTALAGALADKDDRVRESAKDALVKIGPPAVAPLIGTLSHPEMKARRAAADALGKLGDKSAIEALILCLADSDLTVRRFAASSLRKLGWAPKSYVEELAFAIARSEWYTVKRFGSDAIEPLLAVLPSATGTDLAGLLRTLGETGDKRAVDPLLANVSHDRVEVRRATVDALAILGDRKAIGPIIGRLADDSSAIRTAAVEALKQLGWQPRNSQEAFVLALAKRDVTALVALGKPVSDQLLGLLSHRDFLLRETAMEALGKIGEPRAVEPLLRMLGNAKEAGIVRSAAADALGAIGDRRAIDTLKYCLIEPDVSRRAAAALDRLRWSPQNSAERVRYLVASRDKAALLADWQNARRILFADLQSKDARVSYNALDALIGLDVPDTIDGLVAYLETTERPRFCLRYLNSSNERLSAAGHVWAKRRKYMVVVSPTSIGRGTSWAGR